MSSILTPSFVLGSAAQIGIASGMNAGASKLFQVSTPKALAYYSVGTQTVAIAAEVLHPYTSESTLSEAFAKTIGTIVVGHMAGKILAQQMTKVEVTALDILKLGVYSGIATAVVLAPVVIIGVALLV